MSQIEMLADRDRVCLTVRSETEHASVYLNKDTAREMLLKLAAIILQQSDTAVLDVIPGAWQVKPNDEGRTAIIFQIEPLPPLRIALDDLEAREIASTLLQIIGSPLSIRCAGSQ